MKTKYIIIPALMVASTLFSCVNDLNTKPLDPNEITSESVYGSPESYKSGLAKCYGAFALSGQEGGESGEIDGVDMGLSAFLRAMWNTQELCADQAICAWKNDQYNHEMNFMTWGTAQNELITAMYYRVTFSITVMNEYLKQTSDDKLALRGTSAELRDEIAKYRIETRFLRALMYHYGMDAFGAMPFVTEADPIGKYFPPQADRKQLFTFIESELTDIMPLMAEPKAIEFGRVDRAAAWVLLSRLYLNAKVYIGQERYTDAITYASKVIEATQYDLASNYSNIFKSDNDPSNPDVWKEVIFSINFDASHTNAFGTTFLVKASREAGGTDDGNPNGANDITESGSPDAWGGIRAREELVNLFPNDGTSDAKSFLVSPDKRCIIYTRARTKDVADPWTFRSGYSVYKWRSLNSKGEYSSMNFSSTDYPLMRLGEVYLTYAEAVVRGGAGGSRGEALRLVNRLRERAYGNTTGNISDGELTLNFLLDERGRELYWEGFRRTDLIRYDKFTSGDYLWAWKGNSNDGRAVDQRYIVYPIPYADMVANPNLKQNAGY